MASLIFRSVLAIDLGGETIKLAAENTKALASDAKHDVQLALAASAGDGNVTLWDASTSVVDEPAFLGVFVDPDETLSANTPIQVEVTADAVVSVFEVGRDVPFTLGDPDAGAALDAIDGKVTKIRARNASASVVPVRCLALK